MKRILMTLAAGAAMCVGVTGGAYETSTHAAITLNAYQRSNLTQGSVLQLFAFTDPLGTQRGILGWYTTSCVYNGDATVTTPTTPPDDRATIMVPLTGQAIFPFQTVVQFPQPSP